MEKIKTILNELLEKYRKNEEFIIWERSGSINEDTEELEKEIEDYRKRIKEALEEIVSK